MNFRLKPKPKKLKVDFLKIKNYVRANTIKREHSKEEKEPKENKSSGLLSRSFDLKRTVRAKNSYKNYESHFRIQRAPKTPNFHSKFVKNRHKT